MDYITKLSLLPVYKSYLKFQYYYVRSRTHKKMLLSLHSFFYLLLYSFLGNRSQKIYKQKKLSFYFVKMVCFLKKNFFKLNINLMQKLQVVLNKKNAFLSYDLLVLNQNLEKKRLVSLFLLNSCLNLLYQLPKLVTSPKLTKKLVKKVRKRKARFAEFFTPKMFRNLSKKKQKRILKRFQQERVKKKFVAGVRLKKMTRMGIGRRKKRNKKVGFLFIHSTARNLKLTFTNRRGKVKAFYSCGTNRKYKKSRRRLADARYKAMFRMTLEIYDFKYRRLIVVFKQGFFDHLISTLRRRRIRVIAQSLTHKQPHNGCRKPRKKRV